MTHSFVNLRCYSFHYHPISLMKGSSANYTGDGPQRATIERNLCLTSCGLYAMISPRNHVPIVTYSRNNAQVGSIIREINGINLLTTKISQIDLIRNLLIPNCHYHLMTRQEYENSIHCINSSNQDQILQFNSIGVIIQFVNDANRNTMIYHAQIIKATRHFQRNTGFLAGDILYKICNIETTTLNDDELQEFVLESSHFHLYHFIDREKYLRIQKRNRLFSMIKQLWDYDHPCPYCGCIFLQSEKDDMRKKCCLNGIALCANKFPNHGILPDELSFLAYERIAHMSPKCSFYNGVLALGATAVDNGTGGGWEKIIGDHSVKLHGRTYHFLPRTGGCGGLEYFTYNAQDSLTNHITSLNGNVCEYFLRKIFEELKITNCLIQECEQIGQFASRAITNEGQCRELMISLNQKTSHFDIASVTAIHSTGNRILKYQLKGESQTTNIPMNHSLLEPLCYPLFFPWGCGGWGSDSK